MECACYGSPTATQAIPPPEHQPFVWRTRKPDEGKCRLPAAMMAGMVDSLWSFENLSDAVMGGKCAMAA